MLVSCREVSGVLTECMNASSGKEVKSGDEKTEGVGVGTNDDNGTEVGAWCIWEDATWC